MTDTFFEHPILNSPYEYPHRHWELDESGQPTNRIVDARRSAKYVTPIPKPKKQKKGQKEILFQDPNKISSEDQQYDPTPIINELRAHVDRWRALAPSQWNVTPETARLLDHWRNHRFNAIRPFFCQVEAVETAIWLTEVAPGTKDGKKFLEYIKAANERSNPRLGRIALKLATGAGKTTVMAMLIAWQTINSVRRSNSKSFTRGCLIVTPGLTPQESPARPQRQRSRRLILSRTLVPTCFAISSLELRSVVAMACDDESSPSTNDQVRHRRNRPRSGTPDRTCFRLHQGARFVVGEGGRWLGNEFKRISGPTMTCFESGGVCGAGSPKS